MALNYSLKSFLRQAPKHLVRQHLLQRKVGADVPWDSLTQGQIEPIYLAIWDASEKTRRRIECEFYDVLEMADQAGVNAIIEEGQDHHHRNRLAGVDLPDTLGSMDSHLEAVFWTFLNHRRLFDVAKHFHHASTLPRWRKRSDLPEIEPATARDSVKALEDRISGYYQAKEGRGRVCRVDHYARDDKLYWFAYPQDFATGRLEYDTKRRLRFKTQRPAFEVIFIYDRSELSVDTWVKGDQRTLGELLNIFGDVVLGVDLRFVAKRRVEYNVAGLLAAALTQDVRPEDGIECIVVRKLRLRVKESERKQITLEAGSEADPLAVYDLLGRITASERLPLEALEVVSATLAVKFVGEGDRRGRKTTFTVSYPNHCSLKHEGEGALLRKLLKRWGIYVPGSPDSDSRSSRPPVQTILRM